VASNEQNKRKRAFVVVSGVLRHAAAAADVERRSVRTIMDDVQTVVAVAGANQKIFTPTCPNRRTKLTATALATQQQQLYGALVELP